MVTENLSGVLNADNETTNRPQEVRAFAERTEQGLSQYEDFKTRAAELADLFGLTFTGGPHRIALKHVLQKVLLRSTLAAARKGCAFYGDGVYDNWIETPAEAPPDLSCWPIITREQIIDRFDDFISNQVNFSFTSHTSGSTGPSLSIHKSLEEITFLRAFYQRLLRPMMKSAATLPLLLSFPNFYHGVGIPLPSPGKVFVSGVTDDTLIQDAVKVLLTDYHIPGHDRNISIISGLVFHVQFFTSYLLEQKYDLPALKVKSLNVSGGYVSKQVSRFISNAWQAPVFDRYSLTEIMGGATRCFDCDHFHMDPHVIGEVIDVDTGELVETGIGYLVLTSLSPFVQMQPLLRYNTGDLVRRVHNDCPFDFTFDFLGKEKNCIRVVKNARTDWLVFSVDLFEILNGLPDLNVYEWFSNVKVVHDRTIGARQLYQISIEEEERQPPRIKLEIELRYAPHFFPERVKEINEKIVSELRKANKTFADGLDDQSIIFEAIYGGPGSLGNRFVIKT